MTMCSRSRLCRSKILDRLNSPEVQARRKAAHAAYRERCIAQGISPRRGGRQKKEPVPGSEDEAKPKAARASKASGAEKKGASRSVKQQQEQQAKQGMMVLRAK